MAASPQIDKARALCRLLEDLEADLRSVTDSQRSSSEGATHEESRPESDKDTRAVESSYLAMGLAKRVAELQEMVALLSALKVRSFGPDDPIALSALVTVEDDDANSEHYLFAPSGGGLRVTVDDIQMKVVTPQSPLGRALLGKRCGDDVRIQTPKGLRECVIVAVS